MGGRVAAHEYIAPGRRRQSTWSVAYSAVETRTTAWAAR
jgi:hypothetical protein